MKKEDLSEIANSFKTYDEIYEHLLMGDFSVIERKCGTNEYPQINWMMEYFTDNEEYEKCDFLSKLEQSQSSKEKLNKEIDWLKLHI